LLLLAVHGVLGVIDRRDLPLQLTLLYKWSMLCPSHVCLQYARKAMVKRSGLNARIEGLGGLPPRERWSRERCFISSQAPRREALAIPGRASRCLFRAHVGLSMHGKFPRSLRVRTLVVIFFSDSPRRTGPVPWAPSWLQLSYHKVAVP